jgi:hypothetical protein
MPAVNVRKTIEAHARGEITLAEAERILETASWSGVRRYTEAQLAGTEDTPPPPDNSPDWIQLVPGIPPWIRTKLTTVYDRRQRG